MEADNKELLPMKADGKEPFSIKAGNKEMSPSESGSARSESHKSLILTIVSGTVVFKNVAAVCNLAFVTYSISNQYACRFEFLSINKHHGSW